MLYVQKYLVFLNIVIIISFQLVAIVSKMVRQETNYSDFAALAD